MMSELEPVLVVDLFPLERQSLLQLLAQLSEDDWQRPTVCIGWTVKDIVLHVLGDDIGLLSRKRDAFDQFTVTRNRPQLAVWDDLVTFINENNALWVQATRRISSRLACTFLALTGEELYQYLTSLDPFAYGDPVSWAGPDPAPTWLDIAREYTERWVHQQHIRDAVERPGLKDRNAFAPVLETFVWALPHTFREVQEEEGTRVHLLISGEAGGQWSLRREQGTWILGKIGTKPPDAQVVLDQETAWRLFTKGIGKAEALQRAILTGNERLAMKVLDTVSIIA
jgi:uncharacterized protein (TIGR03083 family)